MVGYYRRSWDEIVVGVEKIVHEILNDGYIPDAVIGISKGGAIPAALIADMLGVRNVDLMQISHWTFNYRRGTVDLRCMPSTDISGLRVLIVDDVADTGSTLKAAKEVVERLSAAEVRTAVIDYKVVSSRYRPNYYAYVWSEWVYIVYPWEFAEAFRTMRSEDVVKVFSEAEIRALSSLA